MNYDEFLASKGVDDHFVAQMMRCFPDPIPSPGSPIYPIFSDIQGIGLASMDNCAEGDIVMPLIALELRQVGARYINHSDTPNTAAALVGLEMVAVALEPIEAGEEITMCYEDNTKVTEEYVKILVREERSTS